MTVHLHKESEKIRIKRGVRQGNTISPKLFTATLESLFVERGGSVVECRTRNRVSPGSNPPLLPFRRLDIFVLSIVVPVDSAV